MNIVLIIYLHSCGMQLLLCSPPSFDENTVCYVFVIVFIALTRVELMYPFRVEQLPAICGFCGISFVPLFCFHFILLFITNCFICFPLRIIWLVCDLKCPFLHVVWVRVCSIRHQHIDNGIGKKEHIQTAIDYLMPFHPQSFEYYL